MFNRLTGDSNNNNISTTLPKELDTEDAKSILQRGVDANLLDDNFQPIKEKMTKYQMKEFAELASLELGIKEKWKVFGFLSVFCRLFISLFIGCIAKKQLNLT